MSEVEIETLAKQMYETYCKNVGRKAHNGDPLPDAETFFNDPKKKLQAEAWRETAKSVAIRDVEHEVVDLGTIISYYSKDFKPSEGHYIRSIDWLLDPVRGTVVFSIFQSKKE